MLLKNEAKLIVGFVKYSKGKPALLFVTLFLSTFSCIYFVVNREEELEELLETKGEKLAEYKKK